MAENIIMMMRDFEHIRRRPAMYLGDIEDRGLHQLIWLPVDFALDEELDGACGRIEICLHKDGSVTVADDGPGIPVDTPRGSDLPVLQLLFTRAGYDLNHPKAYRTVMGPQISIFLVLNALTESLEVEVHRRGFVWRQRYSRGIATSELERGETTDRTGTRITFRPDPGIFPDPKFAFRTITERLRELACLVPGLRLVAIDEETGQETGFHEMQALVGLLAQEKALHAPIQFRGEEDKVTVDVALQYTAGEETVLSYANRVRTSAGGTHQSGFLFGLTRVLRRRLTQRHPEPSVLGRTAEDLRRGLNAIVSVCGIGAQFYGGRRDRLLNEEAAGLVQRVTTRELGVFLDANPAVEAIILDRIIRS